MKRLLCLVFTGPAVYLLIVSIFMLSAQALALQPQSDVPAPITYTLSELDGKVTLYRSDESVPVAQYEIYTALLPQQDVELLRNGIPVETQTALRRYLEDFGG